MTHSDIPGLYGIRGVMSVCHLLVEGERAWLLDTGMVGEPLLVRRLLRVPRLAATLGAHATALATAIAGLWALHPLQTAAVTYMVQRAESLAALFYLLRHLGRENYSLIATAVLGLVECNVSMSH